jgi:hypothetical protein
MPMSDTHSGDGSEYPVHPLEQLKKQAEEARQKREKERVHCPECGTTVWKNSMEEAVATADTHDEKQHDGEATAKINGILPPQFTEDEKEQIQEAVRLLKADSDQEADR